MKNHTEYINAHTANNAFAPNSMIASSHAAHDTANHDKDAADLR